MEVRDGDGQKRFTHLSDEHPGIVDIADVFLRSILDERNKVPASIVAIGGGWPIESGKIGARIELNIHAHVEMMCARVSAQ